MALISHRYACIWWYLCMHVWCSVDAYPQIRPSFCCCASRIQASHMSTSSLATPHWRTGSIVLSYYSLYFVVPRQCHLMDIETWISSVLCLFVDLSLAWALFCQCFLFQLLILGLNTMWYCNIMFDGLIMNDGAEISSRTSAPWACMRLYWPSRGRYI